MLSEDKIINISESETIFSVVIPVYNRQDLISYSIESVLKQTFTDFELIIVDDGSTDNTPAVVNSFTDPRIVYFRKENGERGAARNFGFRKAKGKLVVFLDSDDLMKPDHLSNLYNCSQKFKYVSIFSTRYDIIKNEKILPGYLGKYHSGLYDHKTFLKGDWLACNLCLRRNNPKLILFNEDRSLAIMEDWIFMLQNLTIDRLYYNDKATVSLRDHSERSMNMKSSEIIPKKIKAAEWIEKNVFLSDKDLKTLWAYSFFFCAIHLYIENMQMKSFQYLFRAIRKKGLKKDFIILFLKNILGYKVTASLIRVIKNNLFASMLLSKSRRKWMK
ncbi:MAG: glycosyltransferase family 2 protein [Bacteroidales bacterium]